MIADSMCAAMLKIIGEEERRVFEAAEGGSGDPIVVDLPEYKVVEGRCENGDNEVTVHLISKPTGNIMRYHVPRRLLELWKERQ